jgi:hypothetical protein
MPTQPDSEPSSPVRSHMCRGFRRRAGFTVPARDFLAEGLAAGERVLYAAPGDEASLTARLRADGRLLELFGLTGVRVERAA